MWCICVGACALVLVSHFLYSHVCVLAYVRFSVIPGVCTAVYVFLSACVCVFLFVYLFVWRVFVFLREITIHRKVWATVH